MTLPNEQDRPSDRTQPDSSRAEDGAGETAELQAALAAAEAQALESKDLYMRALAELDNVRKRAARDIEHAHKYALERFANDLIGVKDSLELGLATDGAADALRAGTEATLKLMGKAFEKANVTEVSPLGEVFNPEFHEAIVTQPSNEHVPNTVLQVIQKGYLLNGRLLRPARVIVARES
ncbi:MAG: nucleotide exchange factor GrpE [Steroidobacter sp.]